MFDKCPESVTGLHSPADRTNRCAWCGQQNALPAPRPGPARFEPSELTEAYEQFYNPDYGTLDWKQIRQRYRMGLDLVTKNVVTSGP